MMDHNADKVYDALIVGAGIAGASTAYFLGSEGLRVLVVEKEKLTKEEKEAEKIRQKELARKRKEAEKARKARAKAKKKRKDDVVEVDEWDKALEDTFK